MANTTNSAYTQEQITAWLRGLVAIGWADGHLDESEQELIAALTEQELSASEKDQHPQDIAPAALAAALGPGSEAAENFLRTAVMVALADRCYSTEEDQLLQAYCQALALDATVLDSLRATLAEVESETDSPSATTGVASGLTPPPDHHDMLDPLRVWLDKMDVKDPKVAHFLCKMIPPQCPFERDVVLFGRKIAHIPPMCKLNPLYEQVVSLRFRALSYLADDCGEDVSEYC